MVWNVRWLTSQLHKSNLIMHTWFLIVQIINDSGAVYVYSISQWTFQLNWCKIWITYRLVIVKKLGKLSVSYHSENPQYQKRNSVIWDYKVWLENQHHGVMSWQPDAAVRHVDMAVWGDVHPEQEKMWISIIIMHCAFDITSYEKKLHSN